MADSTDNTGFGKFVPGFEFLQNLAQQATGGMAKGVPPSMPQMPSLGNWVAPTFNVEELEKRIQELKAVQFWLEQNSRALSATIQALEVQKMTLATLKGMNFNLGDVAQVLRSTPFGMAMPDMAAAPTAPLAPQADSQAASRTRFEGLEVPPRTPAPEPVAPPVATAPVVPPSAQTQAAASDAAGAAPAAESGGAAPAVDPMQWWGAITQQFQTIATQALKDVTHQANQMASAVGSVNPMEAAMEVAKAATGSPLQADKSTPVAKKPVRKTAAAPAPAKPAVKAAAKSSVKAGAAKRPASAPAKNGTKAGGKAAAKPKAAARKSAR